MESKIINFETAVLAKERGFNLPCFNYYMGPQRTRQSNVSINHNASITKEKYSAPTQPFLQMWLRHVHEIHIYVSIEFVGSNEWEFSYCAEWLPKEAQNLKRRGQGFKRHLSYSEGYGTYIGAWRTYEEAMEEALVYALNLIEVKKEAEA